MDISLYTKIQEYQTFALFGHQNPDGDAIGSVLAMRKILIWLGKTVSCYIPDSPSRIFADLPDIACISQKFDYGQYDCIMFLDFSTYNRIASFTTWYEQYFDSQYKIIIDHHICYHPPWQLNLIDPSASSNCEWIYEHIVWHYQIDSYIANYLYLGLMTDTGNFTYEQDSARTLSIALGLINAWADKKWLIDHIWRSKTHSQVRFLWLLIQRLQSQWSISWSRYDEQDLQDYQLDSEEAKFGLGIIQSLSDIRVTVLFKKNHDILQVSLRSKDISDLDAPDVSQIAHYFGGGGHHQASGFRVPYAGDLDSQMHIILQQIVSMI